MKSVVRTFSIVAYLLIFLQGSMIVLPFGLLLLTGIFSAEPLLRFFIVLADLALIGLLLLSFTKRTRYTTLIEIACFLCMLLPLLNRFSSFPFDRFNYFLFLFPAGCFLFLFPLSIFLADREYRKSRDVSG